MAGALERCVGDPAVFCRDHWGTAPLHRSGDGHPDDLGHLLDVGAVDAIVVSAARRPEIRLVRNGERIDPARYCSTVRLGGQQVSDVVDPAGVAALFADGATVVLQSLHRTYLPVASFAAELEDELSHPVQANAYLTPPAATGLAPHADTHDVIVVQLHGSKAWDVDGLGTVVLDRGHTLYLPAGTKHSAAAQAESSLHLTIGILRLTYRDVARRLVEDLDGSLDRPLPVGYAHDGGGELDAGLQDLLDHLASSFAATDATAVATAVRRRRRPRLRHVGHLASVVRIPEVSPDTRVRIRPGPRPRLDVDGDRVHVDAGDRTLGLPIGARAAMETIVSGAAVSVGSLPELDEASRLVVARRLLREGLVVLAEGA